MQVPKSLAEAIRCLVAGESVAASRLRSDLAGALLDEGLLSVQAHGRRRTYRAIDAMALKAFVESRYEGFRQIDVADNFSGGDTLTRSAQAVATGNSKLAKVRSCPGFPVNAYEPIPCMLNGSAWTVHPPEGSFAFVTDWKTFVIPSDVVVVGVENMENFRMVRRQRALFESQVGSGRLLFVSRYPQSIDLRSWLQGIPNRYVHFGDFDLAGIHIFLTEFEPFVGARASFLIPSDIDERLRGGSMERFNSQFARFQHLHSDRPDLQALIELILRHHRCYDQEGYIAT